MAIHRVKGKADYEHSTVHPTAVLRSLTVNTYWPFVAKQLGASEGVCAPINHYIFSRPTPCNDPTKCQTSTIIASPSILY